jgi:hypothetical protein
VPLQESGGTFLKGFERFLKGGYITMNRKTKAIIDAAVAMGYGTAEDYSGGSVGATLEEFAAIAAQGGGSGGGVADIEATVGENDTIIVNMPANELANAMQKGARLVVTAQSGDGTIVSCLYLSMVLNSSAGKTIRIFAGFGSTTMLYEGTEQDGKTVFSVKQ